MVWAELGSISKSSLLSLANNGFSQTLPPELGNLVGIAVYALYTNKTPLLCLTPRLLDS